MRERAEAEMGRDRLAEIGETFAPAEIARADAGAEEQPRHEFARMIAARPSGIAAMIGGDEGEIARPHRRQEIGQAAVEIL